MTLIKSSFSICSIAKKPSLCHKRDVVGIYEFSRYRMYNISCVYIEQNWCKDLPSDTLNFLFDSICSIILMVPLHLIILESLISRLFFHMVP